MQRLERMRTSSDLETGGVGEQGRACRMRDCLAERAKSGENCQELLDAIPAVVVDPVVPDEDVGA
ncbi:MULTISPECIES: hypothetical protein [Actinosynnema]|uniref:hypothetical protein n=1 Tax=Actinosynnema TaxID=40566 RepID=UPI0020A2C161|nr:hypothetical protein [Actinosynnema pretiosum]MCP2097868.1 hypothetical protein [Actinosynnema pretiosum]